MSKNSRVPVYFSSCIAGPAPHRTSTKFAQTLIRVSWARLKSENIRDGIVLLVSSSWAAVKEHFRGTTISPVARVIPPRREPINLDLSYPAKYQETNGDQLRRALWDRFYIGPTEISAMTR